MTNRFVDLHRTSKNYAEGLCKARGLVIDLKRSDQVAKIFTDGAEWDNQRSKNEIIQLKQQILDLKLEMARRSVEQISTQAVLVRDNRPVLNPSSTLTDPYHTRRPHVPTQQSQSQFVLMEKGLST